MTPNTPMTELSEKVDEMLAGLEGLPPGPWHAEDNEADLIDGKGRWLDMDHGSAFWHHVARCDPDTMRQILTLAKQALSQSLRAPVGEGFDLLAHLARQREWSGKTFGPGPRTAGVIDHIRKELCEIEADPSDITEWIDVVILALDGAWRAGYQPQQIIDAMVAKQTRNEGRNWPDWRTMSPDKAIEHDRSGEPSNLPEPTP